MRHYVIFSKPRTFDTADIKCFTVGKSHFVTLRTYPASSPSHCFLQALLKIHQQPCTLSAPSVLYRLFFKSVYLSQSQEHCLGIVVGFKTSLQSAYTFMYPLFHIRSPISLYNQHVLFNCLINCFLCI